MTAPLDLVVADPCAQTNPELVVAARRADALGVLDLPDPSIAAVGPALAEVARRTRLPFAVRLAWPAAEAALPALTEQVDTVVVTAGPRGFAPHGSPGATGKGRAAAPAATPLPPGCLAGLVAGRRVLVEVTSREEAALALAAGAHGLVAKGCESGGRIGDVESFVLAQHIAELGVPFWVQGGVGLHTAAAVALAGGGVVLDGQLALVRESRLGRDTRAAVAAMDGSETRVVGGHRVYVRPDLPSARLADDTTPEAVAAELGADVRHQLVPLGQDAAVAASLAERHVTVGGVVQAIRAAVDHQLRVAAEQRPLAPGAGVSSTNGTRYPVVQGPMTRVSDRAELAAAVAEGGGLPFLALALLPGDEVRSLLTETATLLGDRPWGVGVLGFVPAEVREAQLEVVHELKPPLALIAGGQPSQARPLDEAGITTYLHVPSPGLLDRFLRDGARRFVFEGRECGGHVGPRASLPLWEAQIGRLLALDDAALGQLDVLFAGGIHDARSAAMVAAAAAPLVERGARIGVLMGTAYLFTDEAVGSGAITPTFQQVAQGCSTTVLLETAPGHATRCVETDYVQAFSARKAELEAAGTPAKELWAELETLNLGRLRVASKGLARQGDTLVGLDDDAQRRDGMYMIGQAATLRHERTTVARLHDEVTAGATGHLARVVGERDRAQAAASTSGADRPASGHLDGPLEVAIVGMAGIFPGAPDTEKYWANVVAGADCITEVPPERWDPDVFYDPESVHREAGKRTPSRWGGFLPEIGFDALAYGIPPRSLTAVEVVQLLSLEVASRALADAGYDERPFDRSRASVIFGATTGNELSSAYSFRATYPHFVGPLPADLDERLPHLTEDSFPGVITNVIAGRIANRLDLGGVNYTVDAACATSMAALDAACKELATGTSDVVLCGAADMHNGIYDYLLFASVHALSPSGRCRSFDASADGITLGEGVACVVLKPLADAERDGDRIYAVIEAVGTSSDGRHLGLTAPRKDGQKRALERAYTRAGVSPSGIGLVEAHGTGTVVGDRTEMATLTEVFTDDEATTPGSTVLGSVKSHIGHTKCAAGLAGLIKVARAVHAGVLPPAGPIGTPNDYYEADTSPFRFLDRPAPWPTGERRAGVSAFGFGGTNFHAVVRSHADDRRPAHGVQAWPTELFLVRAASTAAADTRLADLADLVERVRAADPLRSRHRLRDLAAAVSTSGTGPVQVAVVAADLDDLAAKLAAAAAGEPTDDVFRAGAVDLSGGTGDADDASRAGGAGRPQVAFLHPGQGSQRPGMLNDLFVAFPRLQRLLDGPAAAWVDRMFPGASFTPDQRAAQVEALTDTRVAQPALGVADLAVTRLLGDLGIEPDLVAGHSYGELVALATAGVIDEATLLGLSQARGEAMVAAAEALGDDPGTMAAISLPADELTGRLPQGVVLANHNGPRQSVVAGPRAAVERLVAELAVEKVGTRPLTVAAAFHSPLVAGASQALATRLDEATVGQARIPVWSNASAAPYPTEPQQVRATLAAQLGQPVRFVEQVEAMYAAGARIFVEAGPGRVLTQLVGNILGDRPHLAVACDAPGEPGLTRLLRALAQLAVAGVAVDVHPLFDGRARAVDLTALPVAAPGWRVNGHLVRTHDGAPISGGLQPADRRPEVAMDHGGRTGTLGTEHHAQHPPQVQTVPQVQQPPQPAHDQPRRAGVTDRPPNGRDQTVVEYLRSMQQIVEAQRAVMLAYLGDGTGGPGLPNPAPTEAAALAASSAVGQLVPITTNGNGHGPGQAHPPAHASTHGHATNGNHPVPTPVAAVVEAPTAPEPAAPAVPAVVDAAAPVLAPVAEAPAPAQARVSGDELLAAILAIVGERTGYPHDMLDPDLDLEADLSIDSIKRIEIIGELADRMGLPGVDPASGVGVDDAVIEELARQRTLRSMASWIDARADAAEAAAPGAPAAEVAAPLATPACVAGSTEAVIPGVPDSPVVPPVAYRFVLETAMLAPALPVASAAGKTFAVVSDPWEGLAELCGRLERAGATVEMVPIHRGAPHRALPEPMAAVLARVDGVVHLGAAHPAEPVDARDVFAALQPAITGQATTLVAAIGPHRGAEGAPTGVAGLMRAVARELPQHHVRAVEVAADQAPLVVARLLADEVLDPAGPASVTYIEGTRTTRRVAKGAPLGANPPSLPLDDQSVVVLTGGARGITARAALGLARATGCRLELLGRSPLPGEEDPRTAGAPDRPSLRRALVETGELASPTDIEQACDRIMAGREIRATLRSLSELGVATSYHRVDVRDAAALGAVLDGIRSRHGRIDALVHGAGVLDDRLAADKSLDGFDRVFATKVDAAGHLLARLGADVPVVVFFGSVSGVFGNKGQVDYSAANDALDELAARHDGVDGRRVISIDWGPWGGTGMVSAELERKYARLGVGLIDPHEGVQALLAEMATLPGEPSQVVVMRAEPEALDGRPPCAPGTWTPTGIEIDELSELGEPLGGLTLEDLTERG